MRKVYYIYNPQTQTYDRIYPTVRQRALSILRRLFYGMGLGAGCFIVLLFIFGSPSEKELRIENSRLQAQYNVLSRRLDDAMGVLQDIQQRDDNLYRVILQADPVSPAIRQAGYGGTNRYEELMDLANAKLVVNTTQKLDVLSKRLYIQSKSFDDVVDMCKNHDEMLKCIPAIQPISSDRFRLWNAYRSDLWNDEVSFRYGLFGSSGDRCICYRRWNCRESGMGNRIR